MITQAIATATIPAMTGKESAKDNPKVPKLWRMYEVSETAKEMYLENPKLEKLSKRCIIAGTKPIVAATDRKV